MISSTDALFLNEIMKIYSFSNLIVRGFPTLQELCHPYIYGGVKVIINVSGSEYSDSILKEIESKGIRWYHFPLEEEEVPDMGMENILSAVKQLMKADEAGEKVALHCMYGNNRSRTVAEAFHFKKMGFELEDEYKGYRNHLEYNCTKGYLPPLSEVEKLITEL